MAEAAGRPLVRPSNRAWHDLQGKSRKYGTTGVLSYLERGRVAGGSAITIPTDLVAIHSEVIRSEEFKVSGSLRVRRVGRLPRLVLLLVLLLRLRGLLRDL